MRKIEQEVFEVYRARFGEDPRILASAPGRINLIGEHTDYNGGFVLPCAIGFRVACAMSTGPGSLYSIDFQEEVAAHGCAGGSWAGYPRGVAWAMIDAGHALPSFNAVFRGDVPVGSGLSSSAAIEAATALALDSLASLNLSRSELAVLCQRAENAFIGVRSGIMDQYASLLCQEVTALLLDCRSLEAHAVPFDLGAAGLSLLVCDTRVSRELSATGYNARRAECERAAKAIGVTSLRDAQLQDTESLHGVERKRAIHVVSENARVLAAVSALERSDYAEFGQLMYASHHSLANQFEVSTPELDAFVEIARSEGALGARLTGAGFGGCAIALLATDSVDSLTQATMKKFATHGFGAPAVYKMQPSPGAEVVIG